MLKIAPIATWSLDAALIAYAEAAEDYIGAQNAEAELAEGRHSAKSDAIARIMALPDPQKDNKPYSATAAEKLAETDKGYAAHLESQRFAAAETLRAETAWRSYGFICQRLATSQVQA